MRVKTLLMVGAIAAFVLSSSAVADDGKNNGKEDKGGSFESSVIGAIPGLSAVGGVSSAGAAWVIGQGEASVSSGGRVRVEVKGLTLVNGAQPVAMVGASLVCNGVVAAPVVAVTPSPLSAAGNAEIDQMVTIPTVAPLTAPTCFAPVVLVRVFSTATGQLGPFIAVTGITQGAAVQNQNQGQNEGQNQGHGH